MGRMALIWDVWKSYTMVLGERSAIKAGVTMMPGLHAGMHGGYASGLFRVALNPCIGSPINGGKGEPDLWRMWWIFHESVICMYR